MKLTACMYICVMISYVRKYSLCGFRKINTNLLYTLTIIIACKEKNININIASIVITLTEINNESHYVAKKKTKKKLLRWDSNQPLELSIPSQGSANTS